MNDLSSNSPTFIAIKDHMIQHHSFVPVDIKHGRKFRGFGYVVGTRMKGNGGFRGNGARPYVEYDVNDVYVPDEDAFGEFNGFNEATDVVHVSDEQLANDIYLYITTVLNNAEIRCGSDRDYFKNYVRKVLNCKDMPMKIFDDLVTELFG